jgi:hypothetical protein
MLESPTSQAYTRIGRNVCPIPIADRVLLGWLLEARVFHWPENPDRSRKPAQE